MAQPNPLVPLSGAAGPGGLPRSLQPWSQGAGQSLRVEGRGCPGADGGLLSVAGHTSVLDKLRESAFLNNHLFKPLHSLKKDLGNKHKSN